MRCSVVLAFGAESVRRRMLRTPAGSDSDSRDGELDDGGDGSGDGGAGARSAGPRGTVGDGEGRAETSGGDAGGVGGGGGRGGVAGAPRSAGVRFADRDGHGAHADHAEEYYASLQQLLNDAAINVMRDNYVLPADIAELGEDRSKVLRYFSDELGTPIINLCAGRLIEATSRWLEAQETRMATRAGGAAPTAGAFVVKRTCVLAVLAQPGVTMCFSGTVL